LRKAFKKIELNREKINNFVQIIVNGKSIATFWNFRFLMVAEI